MTSGMGLGNARVEHQTPQPAKSPGLLTVVFTSMAITLLVLVLAGAGTVTCFLVAHVWGTVDEVRLQLDKHQQHFDKLDAMGLPALAEQSLAHQKWFEEHQRASGELALSRCLGLAPALRMARRHLENHLVAMDQITVTNRRADRLGYADWTEEDQNRYDNLARWFQMDALAFNRAVAEYEGLRLEASRLNAREVVALESFSPFSLESHRPFRSA